MPSAVWSKLLGTIQSFFQIGIGGSGINNNSGILESRNSANSSYVVHRTANPAGTNTNDVVNLGFYNQGIFGMGTANTTISSGTTTLADDAYYNNLTISGTGILNTNGFRVFVAGTLDITAAPANSIQNLGFGGANGLTSGTHGNGSGGANQFTVAGGSNGSNGGNGSTTAGAQASAGNPLLPSNGGGGGQGGKGGSGLSGAGGAARIGAVASNPITVHLPTYQLLADNTFIEGGVGGSGGSGGGGDSTGSGAGGAGGSGGSGIVYIAAYNIKRGGSTAASAISVAGQVGGNGGSATTGQRGGGGAGAGSGGGFIYIITAGLVGSTATNAIDVSGGNGGVGGNGFGAAGTGGDGGSSGAGGRFILINLGTGVITDSTGSASVAGGAASGLTGGTAGIATLDRFNL